MFTSHGLLLVETRSGKLSIKMQCGDGSIKALHSLYYPEEEAKEIVDAFQFDGRGILVVLGLGLGYHVHEFVQRFPDAEIVVIEAIPEIYELAKEHGRVSEIEDKARFIVGRSGMDVIEEITHLQIKTGMPPLSVFTLSAVLSVLPDYYRPILNTFKKAVSFSLWEKMRYPKFREDTLRIALMDFDYFLALEIERALKSFGHHVAKIPGNIKKDSASDILSRVIRIIVEFKPDFIVSVNHIGFDEEGVLSSFLNSIEMPVASWYVDSPNIIVKAFGKNVSPYTSVFVWDQRYIEEVRSLGFESVVYLPLATDEYFFKPVKLSLSELKNLEAEVGFVGNSMVKSTDEYMIKLPPELHPLVEKLAQLLSKVRLTFEEALTYLDKKELNIFNSLSAKAISDFETAALRRATLLYRLSCIEKLRGFQTVIHGDKGWKKLLDSTYRIRQKLSYYTDLPLFYNACKINFNATSLQMIQAVNQRVFDVPACGAFILTDYQVALEELFKIGEEVITYEDKNEIPELVRFYLNNPGLREAVARKARGRILKEHTYTNRLNSIIKTMRNRNG